MKKNTLYKFNECIYFLSTLVWFVVYFRAYSLRESKPYYLVAAVLSLILGLRWQINRNKGLEFREDKVRILVTILSLVSPISFVINLYLLTKDYSATFNAKATRKRLIATLILILLTSCGALLFETSFLQVDVKSFSLTQEMTEKYNQEALNGRSYVIQNPELQYGVNVYIPKDASKDNPKPVVFVMPGFTRTKETMAQYAIEFSRRGAVVFTLDPGSQGATTYAGYAKDEQGQIKITDGKKEKISPTVDANGLNYLVQYVYNNQDDFDFIDREQIGAIGHSAGGGNVAALAENFAGESFEDSVIKSLFISGYIKLSSVKRYQNLNSNTALSYAYFDEGSYRYMEDETNFDTIALRFLNEVRGSSAHYDDYALNYPYGDVADGSYRIIHRSRVNHAFEMYDRDSIAHSIRFFTKTLGLEPIDPYNQIWFGKELLNGLSLVLGFIFVVLLSKLLVNSKFFESIKGDPAFDAKVEVAQLYKNSSLLSRSKFWLSMIITAIIACLDYIPLAYLSMLLFPDAASNNYTFFFPARMVNAILLWAVVNGTVGLLIFFLLHFIDSKRAGRKAPAALEENGPSLSPAEILEPAKISGKNLAKTFLLSLILFGSFYLLIAITKLCFHQDFRFMLISAGGLQPRFVVTWLIYILPFFIFYISNSLRVNLSIGVQGFDEFTTRLIGGLANSLGLVFILLINYVVFFKNGQVFYGYYGELQKEVWLYINMVFPLIPMMFLLPVMNRVFYKQTHSIYLGPMVSCMIFIMMTLSASVSYIPM